MQLETNDITKNDGYKKTKIGWIPDNWKLTKLKDHLSYIQPIKFITKDINESGTVPVLTANKSFILGHTDNIEGVFNKLPCIIFDDFTTNTKYVDFCFKVRSSGLKILVGVNKSSDLKFIYEAINIINFNTDDHKRYWISAYQYLDIPTPPLSEQNKISQILSLWDKQISLKNALLEKFELRRKSLELNLFSGKIRFKEFIQSHEVVKTKCGIIPIDWKYERLSRVLKRIKVPLTPIHSENYNQIGIRSHCKGIFHKEAVSGKSLGNKSVFWIKQDCFIVNIVFAWEHAIAKTTINEEGMIASHRFPMYKPNESLDLDFLLFFFKTAMGKHLLGLASPGGAGRNKTLGQGEFIKLKIPVPSLEEQKNIVSILSASENEIDLLKLEITALEEQKKGLMQQLLTGKIRVNKN